MNAVMAVTPPGPGRDWRDDASDLSRALEDDNDVADELLSGLGRPRGWRPVAAQLAQHCAGQGLARGWPRASVAPPSPAASGPDPAQSSSLQLQRAVRAVPVGRREALREAGMTGQQEAGRPREKVGGGGRAGQSHAGRRGQGSAGWVTHRASRPRQQRIA